MRTVFSQLALLLVSTFGMSAAQEAPSTTIGSPTAELQNRPTDHSQNMREPGMEYGYHLHSDGSRICVSGGGNGLVQPIRTELGIVSKHGSTLLYRGSGKSVPRITIATAAAL